MAQRTPFGAKSPHGRGLGLSARLLLLTLLFVMLAEVLIYAPSVASFHRNQLFDRLAAAQVAALVVEVAPDEVPRELEARLLEQLGAKAVAVKTGERRRLLAASETPLETARRVDLRDPSWWMLIVDAFATLLGSGEGLIRAIGPGMDQMDFVEIVLPEGIIRDAMIDFSINLLLVSLFISSLTALLVYLALHRLIVRPVMRLSENVTAFAADPENSLRIIAPSDRGDEIGAAEIAVAAMERSLARELREKKHLAALGLAVSKINHDLRNMLASAQLLSDRLSQSSDPLAQRFAPRLVAALDRAIAFCQATLAYGRVAEREPRRELVRLAELIDEIAEGLGLDAEHPVKVKLDIPDGLTLSVDPEQFYRTLLNLMRNAVQILSAGGREGGLITVTARRIGGEAVIEVRDDGPGVDPKLRERLFQAFNAGPRPGGAGLGLAIAAELVGLHGGRLELLEAERGAVFRITLPRA